MEDIIDVVDKAIEDCRHFIPSQRLAAKKRFLGRVAFNRSLGHVLGSCVRPIAMFDLPLRDDACLLPSVDGRRQPLNTMSHLRSVYRLGTYRVSRKATRSAFSLAVKWPLKRVL